MSRYVITPTVVGIFFAATVSFSHAAASTEKKLAELEAASGGRLGVAAVNTGTGASIRYRADERFPFCSTFKMLLASAVLKESMSDKGMLQRRITYTQTELVSWSPVTEKHMADGMTVAHLCAAAIQFSDNTAANLLLRLIGGPEALTAFARSLSDSAFTLTRWETALNSAIPGDDRDTTTPAAMAGTLEKLAFGDILGQSQREQLLLWLKGNTTGNQSIRAGIPEGWVVGDKTGSGDYGTTNDIAVLWPPSGSPIIIAVYFTQSVKDAAPRKDVLASVASLVAGGIK